MESLKIAKAMHVSNLLMHMDFIGVINKAQAYVDKSKPYFRQLWNARSSCLPHIGTPR